ncbi:MAG: tyrosinase family protein [Actinomycetota bacterium]|nr:tyrosinase family protein [Actinomycetota bacterium]
MAAVRRNIVTDAAARDGYIRGVKLLKDEFLGPTTRDLGMPGRGVPVSTYDLFVAWHHLAMDTFTPPTQNDRNAAHRGPVFLPWHRFMLVLLEAALQRVLRDRDFGLPYWDWAGDGELPRRQQPSAPVWAPECMGGQGSPLTSGPFAFDPADQNSWRVRLDVSVQGVLRSVNRGLRRSFARSVASLPRRSQVGAALGLSTYDAPPWSTTSAGFRNRVEGWVPASAAPGLHNRVHVWVGGDMLPSSSPNDPVFYLNHCNVDRIWAAWQARFPDSPYLPDATAPVALRGHRIDDEMYALISEPSTPRQMLDLADVYTYDTLDL